MQTIFIVALFSTLQGYRLALAPCKGKIEKTQFNSIKQNTIRQKEYDVYCLPGVYAHGWVANVVVDHHPPDEEDQQRRNQEVCDARPDHPNFLETKIKD